MAIALNIELTYFKGSRERYSFLAPLLEDSLKRLGISLPRLYIAHDPLPDRFIPDDGISGNSTLHEAMIYAIEKSELKKASDAREQWYINVVVALEHMDGFLGVMFDTFSSRNTRKGCAVFEREIRKLSNKGSVPFERLFARTVLHEIGHCLNLPHDEELRLMSQTQLLIHSTKAPRWYHNITYDFSQDNQRFVRINPSLARPGGVLLTGGEWEDSSKKIRNSRGLRLTVKDGNLGDNALALEVGDGAALLLQIENVSSRSIRLPLPLNQHAENLQILIRGPKGSNTYRSPMLSCGSSTHNVLLRPGEKRLISLNLFFDVGGYLFPHPGTYGIICRIRKYGKENIWFSSEEIILNIKEPRTRKRLLFKKIFTPAFRKYLTLGGGYHQDFLNRCRNYLKDRAVRRYGFSVPIGWVYIHSLKNLLLKEDDPSVIARSIEELKAAYRQLIREEPSRIRKGKLLYELQKLTLTVNPPAQLRFGPHISGEMGEYLAFKKNHLQRMYARKKNAIYEEKLRKL